MFARDKGAAIKLNEDIKEKLNGPADMLLGLAGLKQELDKGIIRQNTT